MTAVIDKIEKALRVVETGLLVAALSAMVGLAFLQVVLRDFFHTGLLWVDPFLRHLVVWTGFLGAAFAAAEGKHFAWEALKPRSPRTSAALGFLAEGVGALAAFALAFSAAQYKAEEARFGRAAFWIGSFQVPSWFSAEMIVLGFAAVGAHLLLRAARRVS